MPLLLRCPQCRTTLQVPAGYRPTCPRCGFAGRGGAAPAHPQEPVAAFTGRQEAAASGAGQAWAAAGGEGWGDAGEGWPGDAGASTDAATAEGVVFQERPAPQPEPARRRFRLFGR